MEKYWNFQNERLERLAAVLKCSGDLERLCFNRWKNGRRGLRIYYLIKQLRLESCGDERIIEQFTKNLGMVLIYREQDERTYILNSPLELPFWIFSIKSSLCRAGTVKTFFPTNVCFLQSWQTCHFRLELVNLKKKVLDGIYNRVGKN